MHIVRHYCDLSDDLEAWGWVEHNGRNYGKEVIVDRPNNLRLEVNFYIPPSKGMVRNRIHWLIFADWWINSISGQKLDQALPMDVTFIYYVAGQHVNSRIRFEQRERFAIAQGYDPNLNHFRFKFSSNSPYSLHELGAPHDYAWDAVKLLLPSGQNSIPSDFNRRKKKNNFLSIQYQYEDNFKLDVQFSKPKGTICSDIELTSMHFGIATVGPVDFEIESKRFQRRLFRTFKIPRQDHLYCTCKFALSNLLGSIS